MSRSIKAPYVKQKQHKKDKRLATKRVRRNKDEIADGQAFRKESNSYDISDWSFRSDEPKARRK